MKTSAFPVLARVVKGSVHTRAKQKAKRAGQLVLLPCMLLVGVAGMTRAQGPAELPFTLKQVGTNVWAAIDNANAKAPAMANAGFVIGDEAVLIIDTFASAEAAKQLLAEIRKLTNVPVKFVINSHYHADHVAGNGVFIDAGAAVLAQRNVRGWIHAESLRMLGKEVKPEQKAFIESLRPPTVVYGDGVNLYLGSREIQVRSFPGHTGGDSVVLIPDAKVAFGGDLFWRNTLPNTIDASTKPWIDTLNTLAKNQADYSFVPGHGDVGNARDVAAFRDYLATLQKLVADTQAQGKSGRAIVEALMPTLTETYGQWSFFKYFAEPNILQADEELSGKKRIPQVQGAK